MDIIVPKFTSRQSNGLTFCVTWKCIQRCFLFSICFTSFRKKKLFYSRCPYFTICSYTCELHRFIMQKGWSVTSWFLIFDRKLNRTRKRTIPIFIKEAIKEAQKNKILFFTRGREFTVPIKKEFKELIPFVVKKFKRLKQSRLLL